MADKIITQRTVNGKTYGIVQPEKPDRFGKYLVGRIDGSGRRFFRKFKSLRDARRHLSKVVKAAKGGLLERLKLL